MFKIPKIDREKLKKTGTKDIALTKRLIAQRQLNPSFKYDNDMLRIIQAGDLGRVYFGKNRPIKGLRIIKTFNAVEGEVWCHCSFSYSDRMPAYSDILWVRQNLFPSDAEVVQIFPPEDRHINVHSFTLHLWSNIERSMLPRFDRDGLI